MNRSAEMLLVFLLLLRGLSGGVRAEAAPSADAPTLLRASSDFPGGSAKVLGVDPTNAVVRITPAGDPERGWPCWWYLRLDGVEPGKPVVLEVFANEAMVRTAKPGQRRKLPPAWSLPARAAFSTDGSNWHQTAPGQRQGARSSYRVNSPTNTLWLAWGPPFTLRDAQSLLERAARLCPQAKGFELARTRAGRPVPALRISGASAAGGQRPEVWVQARQHAWECGSSWVSCGLADWLVSKDPSAVALRQTADVVIVPIMDVDNVETGNGGKLQVPCDQNEDWGSAPHFPEVRAAMDRLSALAGAGRLSVFLDLHNPSAGDRNVFIYIPPKPLLDPVRLTRQTAFTNLMAEQVTGPLAFLGKIGPAGDSYDPAVDKSSDAWAASAGGSRVVSLTVETPWNTPASTADGYRQVGRQLGLCLLRYLQRPSTGSADGQ